MTRGNQRDQDREKAQKKAQGKKGKQEDFSKRKETDAEVMR